MKRFLLIILLLFTFISCNRESGDKSIASDANIIAIAGNSFIKIDDLIKKMEESYGSIDMTDPLFHETLLQALDELIQERLILQIALKKDWKEAEKKAINILNELKKEYGSAQFRENLLREGLSEKRWLAIQKIRILQEVVFERLNQKCLNTPLPHINKEKISPLQKEDGKIYCIRQIIVPSKTIAEQMVSELKSGASITELVKKYRKKYPIMGTGEKEYVEESFLPENIAKILSKSESGLILPSPKTEYGFHLIELISKNKKELKKPYIDNTSQLNWMKSLRREKCYKEWIEALKANSRIEIFEERIASQLKKIILPQKQNRSN